MTIVVPIGYIAVHPIYVNLPMTLRSMSTSTPQRPHVNGHTAHRYQTKAPAARPQIQGGAPLLAVTPPRPHAHADREHFCLGQTAAPHNHDPPAIGPVRLATDAVEPEGLMRHHTATEFSPIFLVTALIGGYIVLELLHGGCFSSCS